MVTNTVLGALSFLASVCDGASSDDRRGFSGADSDFGKDLARKGAAYGLSEKQFAHAQRFAHKYRKQLKAAGFDAEALAAEVWQAPAMSDAAPQPEPQRGQVPAFRLDAFPNRFAGRCCGCGAKVDAGHGVCGKLESGKWAVRCDPACGAEPARECAAVRDGRAYVEQVRRAPEADPAADPDHADPAYWRHCAQVEREAGNMAGAAVLELYAADMADPRVRLRVVGPNGEALTQDDRTSAQARNRARAGARWGYG